MARFAAMSIAALLGVNGRLLAPPADDNDVDAQIRALQSQIASKSNELAEVGGTEAVQEVAPWEHHCKDDFKAKLDEAAKQADPEAFFSKSDKPKAKSSGIGDMFDAQMEALDRKQLIDNEEFLLGVLIMHQTRDNWSVEQYLDTICAFGDKTPLARQLYWHHKTGPLAAQFASMMDAERKTMKPTRAPPMDLDQGVKGLLASVMAPGAKKSMAMPTKKL